MINHGEAKGRYEQLARYRTQILDRAEKCAAYTIPSLVPPQGHTEGSSLPQPYQSLGAKAVNNLAAKILLALFPPNTSFFKLGFDDLTAAALEADEADLQKIIADIAAVERAIVTSLEQTKLRPVMSMSIKHLIVTGNYVVDTLPELNFRGFGLKHFVVNRDPEGNVLELVIREEVSPLTLSEETKKACFSESERDEFSTSPEKSVEIFTVMQRVDNKYQVFQETNGYLIPETEGTYPLNAPRFIVLRWTSITDEDYGRGMVDEYYGDIKAYDDLSRDLLKASAAAAKIIFTVDPNSYIKPKMLEDAYSGDVLKGKETDVGTISIDKLHDFNVVLDRHRDIQRDLSEAFLMHSSIQRDAERVTAEEIRFMAQELEDTLGGVYSILAQELQNPLVRRVLKIAETKKIIPGLTEETLQISVTTGLEALGRGHEVNKIMQFFQIASQIVPPEQLALRVKLQDTLSKIAVGLGIDFDSLVKTDDEVQAEMQQAQAQDAMAQATPGVAQEVIKQGGLNG